MWCDSCGAKMPEGGAFCPVCGKGAAKKPEPAVSGFFSPGSLMDEDIAGKTADAAVPEVKNNAPAAHVKPAGPMPIAGREAEPIKPAIPEHKTAFSPMPQPAVTKTSTEGRRISFSRELKLLLRQGWLVMLGERRTLIFSLMFPVLAAVVTIWVAGKSMFDNMEATRSACFVLVCAAIWCGLFNSIQVVVKERENIKRDYVSGALRIECYVISRSALQLLLCFVQSLILVLAIPGVSLQYGNPLPRDGLLLPVPMVEFFISLFFVMYAADMLGLLISSVVKKQELASQLAPYILIVQLLFSGVLFKMEGGAELISALMISRWGMEALGSICDLNELPLRLVTETKGQVKREQLELFLERERETESAFAADGEHLAMVWLIMLLFIVVQIVAANVSLRGVKKDTRM